MRVAVLLSAFLLASGPLAARAETCPEVPDEEVALRRSIAKEWFAKAEESEASGDRQAAIRRYACSLSLAPHPSTAYNLGTVAEKSGDLSAALDGFRTYLKLAPEATDRPAIEARIAVLDARVAELRKDIAPKAAPAALPAAPPPAVAPGVAVTLTPAPSPAAAHGKRTAGLVMGAGAVAALGAGVVLNLVARSKMNTCYSEWNKNKNNAALDRCDEAKPFAYGSYALFGAAGVAGPVTAALLLWKPEAPSADEPPEVSFEPSLLPGGAALFASGRF